MNTEQRLRTLGDFSHEELCKRIIEKYPQYVKVKKKDLAVCKMAKIVEVFLKLSNQKGFHATSLRDLAKASGLSMGGLYSYFDSKDTLLLMVLDQVVSSAIGVLQSAPRSITADPALHLKWLIETHVLLTDAMNAWFLFVYMEAKSFPPVARKKAVENEEIVEEIFEGVLRAGIKTDQFKEMDTKFTAGLIKPLLQEWYVKRSKWRRRGVDSVNYAEKLAEFVMNTIRPVDVVACKA